MNRRVSTPGERARAAEPGVQVDHRPFEVNDGLRIATPLRTALDVPVKVDQYAVREIERRDRGRRGRGVGGGPADVGEDPGAAAGADPAGVDRRGLGDRTDAVPGAEEAGYTFEQNALLGQYFRDGVHEPAKLVVKDYWKANDAMARGYRHLTFSDVCIDLHRP